MSNKTQDKASQYEEFQRYVGTAARQANVQLEESDELVIRLCFNAHRILGFEASVDFYQEQIQEAHTRRLEEIADAQAQGLRLGYDLGLYGQSLGTPEIGEEE